MFYLRKLSVADSVTQKANPVFYLSQKVVSRRDRQIHSVRSLSEKRQSQRRYTDRQNHTQCSILGRKLPVVETVTQTSKPKVFDL